MIGSAVHSVVHLHGLPFPLGTRFSQIERQATHGVKEFFPRPYSEPSMRRPRLPACRSLGKAYDRRIATLLKTFDGNAALAFGRTAD